MSTDVITAEDRAKPLDYFKMSCPSELAEGTIGRFT